MGRFPSLPVLEKTTGSDSYNWKRFPQSISTHLPVLETTQHFRFPIIFCLNGDSSRDAKRIVDLHIIIPLMPIKTQQGVQPFGNIRNSQQHRKGIRGTQRAGAQGKICDQRHLPPRLSEGATPPHTHTPIIKWHRGDDLPLTLSWQSC